MRCLLKATLVNWIVWQCTHISLHCQTCYSICFPSHELIFKTLLQQRYKFMSYTRHYNIVNIHGSKGYMDVFIKWHFFTDVHWTLNQISYNPNTFSLSSLSLAYLIWNWHHQKWWFPPESNPGPLAHQSLHHPCQATTVTLPSQRFRTCIGPVSMT